MGDAVEEYQRLCGKYHVERQHCVEAALRKLPEVDLSHQTITEGTCCILGKWLQTCRTVTKLSLADCLLEPSGLKSILWGLRENRSIHTINLKGNNIKGDSCIQLATLLHQSTTIKRLSLEWNPTGEQTGSFLLLCEAFQGNSSLQYLDLRSNLLNQEHASSIIKVVQMNTTLLSLDLRWNKLTEQSGGALLMAIKSNRNIIRLDLAGNNIDASTLQLIDQHIKKNSRAVSGCGGGGGVLMSSHHPALHHSTTPDFTNLRSKLSHTTQLLDNTRRDLDDKILSLRERQEEVAKLQSELQTNQCAASSAAERVGVLEQELRQLRHSSGQHREQDAQTLQEVRHQLSESQRLQSDAQHRLSAEEELHERSKSQLSSRVLTQQEQLIAVQAQLRAARIQADKAQTDNQEKHQKSGLELQLQHDRDVEKMKIKQEHEQSVLEQKLAVASEGRLSAEAELVTLRAQLQAASVTADVNIATAKQKLKLEQTKVTRELEARITASERDRCDTEDAMARQAADHTQLSHQILALTRRNNSLVTEKIQLAAAVENLRAEVATKEAEVRAEFAQTEDELRALKEQHSKTQECLQELQSRQLEEQQQHAYEISRLRQLEDRRRKEDEDRREEDRRKRNHEMDKLDRLHCAIRNYVGETRDTQDR